MITVRKVTVFTNFDFAADGHEVPYFSGIQRELLDWFPLKDCNTVGLKDKLIVCMLKKLKQNIRRYNKNKDDDIKRRWNLESEI